MNMKYINAIYSEIFALDYFALENVKIFFHFALTFFPEIHILSDLSIVGTCNITYISQPDKAIPNSQSHVIGRIG